MRHFENKMPDYVPASRVNVDKEYWKQVIKKTLNAITSNMPPTVQHCDGGLYVGCAGVAYMFYYLANSAVYADEVSIRKEFLIKARTYLDTAMSYVEKSGRRDDAAAFLLGDAGVYAVRSLVLAALGQTEEAQVLNNRYAAMATTVQPVNYLRHGADELFVGRAGYLCGALLLNGAQDKVVSDATIAKVCESMVHSGKTYAAKHDSPSPLMYAYHKTEYLGAAHGLSSILQMLMSFPNICKTYEPLLRQSVDFVLSVMQRNGNTAPAMDEVTSGRQRGSDDELVHWCHGAAGVVYLFARAFVVWGEPRYLEACRRCGELVWQKGLLRKGPGICHGVAGSGYVFLLLYRLTSDEKHWHRALKFAQFMQSSEFAEARTPDTPYSLFEGLAGTVCFLTDLMQPNRAEFPFFNVFA